MLGKDVTFNARISISPEKRYDQAMPMLGIASANLSQSELFSQLKKNSMKNLIGSNLH